VAHIRRFIEISLIMREADRDSFEGAARRCYGDARLSWHGNIIWVKSPLGPGHGAHCDETAARS
jgi:hypothetical protein